MMYTREDYITAINDLYNELGKVPKPKDMENTPGTPPVKMFLSYFGTWNNAIRNAGFNTNANYTELHPAIQKQEIS